MRLLYLCLALLLIAPVASAAHAPSGGGSGGADRDEAGGNIHDEYRVPYNLVLGGLGGSLFQGEMVVYVTYQSGVQDNDHANNLDAARATVTLQAYGPGSNVDAGTFTLSVLRTTCNAVTLANSGAAVNTATSYATATWDFDWDNTSTNPETCQALLKVQRSGSLGFELVIPAHFINDDPEPSDFEELIGLSGLEALALILPVLVLFLFLSGNHSAPVLMTGAVLLLLVGVLFLFFPSSPLWIMIGLVCLLYSAGTMARAGLAMRQKNKPKGPFQ